MNDSSQSVAPLNATRTAQRAVPTACFRQRHNSRARDKMLAAFLGKCIFSPVVEYSCKPAIADSLDPGFEPAVVFNRSFAHSARLAQAAGGPITARNPASVLQMHPMEAVCLDEEAVSRLR